MKISEISMVIIFSVGMGLGQLLLKFSAQNQVIYKNNSWVFRLTSLFSDWYFLLGVLVYGLLLVYWVWLLTFIPLSKAYPFTLLSIVIAALGGVVFFNESLSTTFLIGLSIIGLGLVILGRG